MESNTFNRTRSPGTPFPATSTARILMAGSGKSLPGKIFLNAEKLSVWALRSKLFCCGFPNKLFTPYHFAITTNFKKLAKSVSWQATSAGSTHPTKEYAVAAWNTRAKKLAKVPFTEPNSGTSNESSAPTVFN
eukprot:scaffold78419_cov60-Phaeocystis_antarctica.AAC.1